jgi:DNA-binding Lrp family transcriptional regulator
MDMKVFDPLLQARLIEVISQGLPLVSRPYEAIAKQIGCCEQDVISGIELLLQTGDMKRFGVVVRHRKLGYKANGMVVWNIPDEHVEEIGHCFSKYDFVTLCYQRPRRLPEWQYNLFSMVHGKDRDQVLKNIDSVIEQCDLESIEYKVLFSKRCFKQRGALYTSKSSIPSQLSNVNQVIGNQT